MSDLTAIQHQLRTAIAPALGLDERELEVIAFEDGILSLRLGSVCASCPASLPLIIQQLETELRQHFPNVEMVEAVI